MRVISCKEAKALGFKRYFTGKPCKHGHVAERVVSSRGCTWCVLAGEMDPSEYYRVRRQQRARYSDNQVSERARSVQWVKDNFVMAMLVRARQRAKAGGFACTIAATDIHVPANCPACNVRMERSEGRASSSSPSLDKISPSSGYIPGNVAVICNGCNKAKSNRTLEQLVLLVDWLRAAQ